MCGEHLLVRAIGEGRSGSSPHVRGTPSRLSLSAPSRGIIPACAGNTYTHLSKQVIDRDHPRMCGEHSSGGYSSLASRGSSPHVRGTPDAAFQVYKTAGIIPACAGNTRREINKPCHTRDHPRMCGEHMSDEIVKFSNQGSSPHVRGTLFRKRALRGPTGIIPACAGNTASSNSGGSMTGDHPRMCGEHQLTVYSP